MKWVTRGVENRLRKVLVRQKPVLLLGPRQRGKTTLIQQLEPDLLLNFLRPEVRQRFKKTPAWLAAEVETPAGRTWDADRWWPWTKISVCRNW